MDRKSRNVTKEYCLYPEGVCMNPKENLNRAYKKVVAYKGASGVDGVTVEELGDYTRRIRM